ncbi:hypothetical protein TNCV_3707771 [Trichonephila clavipes]|nr:hypothetical protein TNCV_3707771 [Trichonephila clavipes]
MHIQQHSPLPSNLQDLKCCITIAWYSLEVNAFQKHIDTKLQRIRAVIRAKAKGTKYTTLQETAGLSKSEDFINEILDDATSVMNLTVEERQDKILRKKKNK